MDNMYNHAILWDLDGTLLDTSGGSIASVLYTIKTMHYPAITNKELQSFIGPPVRAHLQSMFHLTDEEAAHAMHIFRDYYAAHELFNASVYDNMYELLSYLQSNSVLLGVATNKRTDMAQRLLHHFKLDCYFDIIEGSNYEGTYSKLDILNNCLTRITNIHPSNVIYIGDSPSDGLAAQQAGIRFIGVTYGFGFSSLPDITELSPEYHGFSDVITLSNYLKSLLSK